MPPVAPRKPTAPWPTDDMLQRMGLVKCPADGCLTWVDPVNVPSRHCQRHQERPARRNPGALGGSRPRFR